VHLWSEDTEKVTEGFAKFKMDHQTTFEAISEGWQQFDQIHQKSEIRQNLYRRSLEGTKLSSTFEVLRLIKPNLSSIKATFD
jgi:hypothetical protein